jgi:hypothetical protein
MEPKNGSHKQVLRGIQRSIAMSAIPKVAAYITGHGFGHAVRCAVVLSELRLLLPTIKIIIKTDVPPWLFSNLDSSSVRVMKQRVDQSPAQKDAFTLDHGKTIDGFSAWLKQSDSWITAETEWLRKEEVSLVIADISPLALSAAGGAGIRSALVANFVWDWILQNMHDIGSSAKAVTGPLRRYVEDADWLFMAEPATPLAHPRPIHIGLVGRRCSLDSDSAKRALKIPEGKRVILVSFGGFGSGGIDFSPLNECNEFLFISTHPLPGIANCLILDPRMIDHACLMMASDVVVGKLGYGTVVEALVHGTPFIFSPREDWPEEPALREEVENRLPSVAVPMTRFRTGKWVEELRSLAYAERADARLPLGGRQIAETLAAFLVDHNSISPAYYPSKNQLSDVSSGQQGRLRN